MLLFFAPGSLDPVALTHVYPSLTDKAAGPDSAVICKKLDAFVEARAAGKVATLSSVMSDAADVHNVLFFVTTESGKAGATSTSLVREADSDAFTALCAKWNIVQHVLYASPASGSDFKQRFQFSDTRDEAGYSNSQAVQAVVDLVLRRFVVGYAVEGVSAQQLQPFMDKFALEATRSSRRAVVRIAQMQGHCGLSSIHHLLDRSR